jgi:hypothetical protein
MKEDIKVLKRQLKHLPKLWEGKKCILELKEADYNWRQMEWWAFYFEFLCRSRLNGLFEIPSETFGTVTFDAKREINWDFKAKAIKSDDHRAILNDKKAMLQSVEKHGAHGVMIAMCDVEYNDVNRTFQKWHAELKGGLSKYERERIARTSVSRYRKTKAELQEILFFLIDTENVEELDTMRQGRNSNGKPRPEKFMLDFEKIDSFIQGKLTFK